MAKRIKVETDLSTEEKIKDAARKVFMQKGYSATRTRDIAEEAGINLALLNYYFRSKEKLFELVMIEKMQKFFSAMAFILFDTENSLTVKVEKIVANYVDMLLENPDIPIFVLSEIRSNPAKFLSIAPVADLIHNSHFMLQLREKRPDINPLHFIFNIMGMTVFPFIGGPVFKAMGALNDESFAQLMEERKKLVPLWVESILEST